MVTHMKTTVEIPDPLLAEAKAIAAKEKTTVKALLEEGLRKVITDRKKHRPFRLKDGSFGGRGLQPEFVDGDWSKIRGAIYEGRGA
jgi:hypothetical protein